MKKGEVVQLGRHRLMCGDSTSPSDVSTLMGGAEADLLFCDPPYGMGKQKDGILHDNMSRSATVAFCWEWLPVVLAAGKPAAQVYICGNRRNVLDLWAGVFDELERRKELFCQSLITWSKGASAAGQCSAGMRCFTPGCEYLLHFSTAKQTIEMNRCADDFFEEYEEFREYFSDELKKTGLPKKELFRLGSTSVQHWTSKSEWQFPAEGTYIKLRTALAGLGIDFAPEYYEKRREYYEKRREYYGNRREYYGNRREYYENRRGFFDNTAEKCTSVWEIPTTPPSVRRIHGNHAACKPYELLKRVMAFSCPPGGIVFDPFGGGGATLVVAEKIGATAYLMELSPHWCDVICNAYYNQMGDAAMPKVKKKATADPIQLSMKL